ncbi:DUF1501 domain-containing protein [Lignipirellula cremea]|uniref:DUF1501 domain-containing protein n=1 Tax=Lignipirellula cremea TaxID=2528010 RepID=A0A518DT01_9BACT|nr:DUF1501 domain-containing protein [Lignipirellula cremea]QDU94975.1 hypothetical protein Pla8534_27840 [Lignipirellula cremea]
MFDVHFDAARRGKGRGAAASRRDFLRVGGLSALGLGLSPLLQAQATAGEARRAKSVILVYLGGGMSHHDSFDLKPDASAEIRGKYHPIPSNVPGLHVGELLPLMARTMDKVCLVRSGAHNNDHHETATNWVMSGRFGSAFGDWPAMGAVAAHESGFPGTLPPYVAVPKNPSFTWELGKSAFLGGRCESFKAGDPNAEGYRVRDVIQAEPLSAARVQRRQSLLATVDQLAQQVEGSDQLQSYDQFQQRATQMVLSGEARRAFAIEQEADALRDRYGRTTFGQSCLLARRLVENGVGFVTVNFGGWDHHAKIWDGLENKLPDFDRGFSALLGDMHDRGLLEDTLVLAMGEFGRSPLVNKDQGRDHWARAASMLFAGAGVQPGRVVGETDRTGGEVTSRPIGPADVACTVFRSLGIDPRKQLSTPDGRPVEILDQGRVIDELYG